MSARRLFYVGTRPAVRRAAPAPAALTRPTQNRLLTDCDALEVNGLGLVSDVLRVLVLLERAGAA